MYILGDFNMISYYIIDENDEILKENLTLSEAENWLNRFLYLGHDCYIEETTLSKELIKNELKEILE